METVYLDVCVSTGTKQVSSNMFPPHVGGGRASSKRKDTWTQKKTLSPPLALTLTPGLMGDALLYYFTSILVVQSLCIIVGHQMKALCRPFLYVVGGARGCFEYFSTCACRGTCYLPLPLRDMDHVTVRSKLIFVHARDNKPVKPP